MRAHITLMTEDKTVKVHIEDMDGVAAATKDPLISELHDLFQDVIASNSDAGLVEITPDNAAQVLGVVKPAAKTGT